MALLSTAASLLALVVLLGLALLWGLSLFSWLAMARRPAKDPRHIEERLLSKGEIRREWIEAPWVVAKLDSPGGYQLAVRGLPGVNGRLVVIHHGVTWNWMGALKYAAFLHGAGYSVALFDSRGHGDSGGRGPSFGIHEARDLSVVAAWARAEFPSDSGLALFGVSLGAATVMQYAALDPAVAAVVADCPFSSAADILSHRLLRTGVPGFLRAPIARRVDRLCRLVDGFSIYEASPARAALATKVPLLLIHGLEDDYVPFAMSEAMAEERRRLLPDARTGLLLVPGASHAKSHRAGPAAYEMAVLGFLEECFGGAAGNTI